MQSMIDAGKIIEKAKHSPIYLRLLNWSLDAMIPFNKPHGFRIVSVGEGRVMSRLPYKKRNLNHIGGLHACALATLSEFTTGFLLISRLQQRNYRLIMQRMEMEYHYQGKMDAVAEFALPESWFAQHIIEPLKMQDAVVVTCEIKIHDKAGNHLSTGKVYWQVKHWTKVRTKVAGS